MLRECQLVKSKDKLPPPGLYTTAHSLSLSLSAGQDRRPFVFVRVSLLFLSFSFFPLTCWLCVCRDHLQIKHGHNGNKRHCSPFGRFLQRSCIYICVGRLTLSRPQQHTDVSIHLFHAGLNLNLFFFWGEKQEKNKQTKKQSDSIGKFDWTLGMIIHSTPFSFFFPQQPSKCVLYFYLCMA